MNVLCKLLGHKYTDYETSSVVHKNEMWVYRRCKRCGHYDGKWLPL